jgi:hypothetical protein
MTINQTVQAVADERPPGERRLFVDRMASGQPATARAFAWRLLDPFGDRYELRAGGHTLASLTIGGLAAPSALLDGGGRRIVFTVQGVGNRRVEITDAATGQVVGDFGWHRPGRDGVLRLVEGGQFGWGRSGRWHPTFTFTNRFGDLLLRLRPDGRALVYAAHPRRDLTLLLTLGWFLLVTSGAAAPAEAAASR